ncbi:MAG: hypothetical protein K2P71_11270, partial [Lachnospiraceae bacterium]|nr:hypothetical protein [Lachnospiraceae bacterium]
AVSKALKVIYQCVLSVLRFILAHFAFLRRKARAGGRRLIRRSGRFVNYMKKKLTACRKVLNIILCKR